MLLILRSVGGGGGGGGNFDPTNKNTQKKNTKIVNEH